MSVGLHWFKSTHSSDEGECLEVAHSGAQFGRVTAVHLRDAPSPAEPGRGGAPRGWA
ncbi:DUF397 domain-containing protein, partial [Streptomyces sp. NPDC127574]|uniref:DUF397 domain-containing protein n=1 Tax=Streptomyces sp. NPDC127574 TaxID=3345401 RepID=UPI003637B13A